MKTEAFDYRLDESLIAKSPVRPRDSSKLLILGRNDHSREDAVFSDILNRLGPDDVLVFNETKVIKARLKGMIVMHGGRSRAVEVLLESRIDASTWECAVFPGERLKPGKKIRFVLPDGETGFTGEVLEMTYAGRIIRFDRSGNDLLDAIERIGEVPLPPYLKTAGSDLETYNTVYARIEGSAAAPTAGLHFTQELLEKLGKKGVIMERVNLTIGLGTYKTITSEHLTDHVMHSERIMIEETTASRLNRYKSEGKRIIAVGTTVVRTLESFSDADGRLSFGDKKTDIFIYPGYRFRFVDSLITNFHLPKSSLLMLVCAFYDRDRVLDAYTYAQQKRYRFFSFGDAMWIV